MDALFIRPSVVDGSLRFDVNEIQKRIPSLVPTYEYDEEFFEIELHNLKPYQRKMQYYFRLMIVEEELYEPCSNLRELVYEDKLDLYLEDVRFQYVINEYEFVETLLDYCKDKGI